MADGNYIIDTKIESSDLNKDLKKVSKQFDDVSDAAKDCQRDVDRSFDKIGDAAKETGEDIDKHLAGAFENIAKANIFSDIAVDSLQEIGEKTLEVAQQSIEAAAEIRASNAQFAQTFQGVEKTARESLNAIADETGITASRMQESYTSIFAFARSVGAETEEALDISSRAMIVAADSAAYYDRSLEETVESLQSFLKGNYENDAALGLSATETTRNAEAMELFGKKFQDLTEIQKQQTLLAMVEDAQKLSGAMGQASREADSWANVTGELAESWKQFIAVFGEGLIDDLTPIFQGITGALKDYVELRNSLKGDNPIADEVAEVELAAQQTAATVQQLRAEYDAAKESARQSLDAQIGLFDELVLQSETGAAQIIENWKSQREAFAQYTENLKAAVNMGLDQALVQQLSDGSAQSMSILNALVNDTDISIDDINTAFQGVSESRDTVSSVMAELQTDMSARLDALSDTVEGEWGAMSDIVGAEIANMQNYINSLQGNIVYVDVVTRYIAGGSYGGQSYNSPTGYSAEPASTYAVPSNIPYLATGAVIPPNAPFYAVLGDQSSGRNLEAPEGLIRQIVREESGGKNVKVEIEFTGSLAYLAQILAPEIHSEIEDMARAGGW